MASEEGRPEGTEGKQEVEFGVIGAKVPSIKSGGDGSKEAKGGADETGDSRETSNLQVAMKYDTQLPDDDVLYYDDNRQELRKRVLSTAVHPDDRELIEEGKLDEKQVKILRHSRAQHYANPIEGPVLGGTLSRWTLWAYAPPSLTTVPIPVLISVFVIQFYEKVGASLSLLAFFQGLARGFDVVTDPCMSYLTDSCRSKHGRRRPFLATGAPIYSLCLILLLAPSPGLNTDQVSVWFGCFYILFFLTSTYTSIPYDALGPELTDNEKDRSTLFFTCTMFDGFGGLAVALLPAGMLQGVNMYRATCTEGAGACERYQSCDVPDVNNLISAASAIGPWIFGESSAPEALANFNAQVNASAVDYGFIRSDCASNLDEALIEASRNSSIRELDFVNWCKCQATADQIFALDSDRYAFLFVGMFFGIWAFLSLWYCVYMVKERSQLGGSALAKSKALVPAILNTFANKPFTLLLSPAILDAFSNALITSLLTFFIRYIVQPEYSNPELGCKPVGGSDAWQCSSSYVLAASFLAFLTGALLFTPLWLFLANRFGKTDVWLAWSFSNGVTFLAYAFVGKGDVYLCIIMSIINGAPAGAKFLADAIMADVIDYDEFLTGSRNEATYTMFKAFLPKIAAIPASAIPIALLSSFGHVELVDGVIQEQPQSLRTFIRIMIIYMPASLSFMAWYLKTKYPLKTTAQVEMITKGVANHLLNQSSRDPCSGLEYKLVHFDDNELEDCDLVDTFPGASVVDKLLKNGIESSTTLIRRSFFQLFMAILWLVSFLGMAIGTFDLLKGELSYIPVLAIVCFGVGITAVGFTGMRLSAAIKLKKSFYESLSEDSRKDKEQLLKKLLKKREDLAEIRKFQSGLSICSSKK